MKDYTATHTYSRSYFSLFRGIGTDTRETKPIKHSLRMWPLSVGAKKAKAIEQKLASHLHDELNLNNHYLQVLKSYTEGNCSSPWRTTKDGELIWDGPKELHSLGPVWLDKEHPEHGPTAKFKKAVAEIDEILRENQWLQVR